MNKHARVSIVIPVYNEADHLAACLTAIARQSVTPYEVLVVDNNSADASVAVAQQFAGVRVLHERRQGVVHARNRGFDAAAGDIIARIDGDTILPTSWVDQVQRIFADPAVAAVSGAPDYYDFAFSRLANAIDHPLRQRLARQLGNTKFLYGANMALKATAWRAVRSQLCARAALHEDFDLAIHLQGAGYQVAYSQDLLAGVSARRIDTGIGAYVRYTLISPATYKAHGLSSRRHMYPSLLVSWICYLPGRVLFRAFDQQRQAFSWQQLLTSSDVQRVNPATFVD